MLREPWSGYSATWTSWRVCPWIQTRVLPPAINPPVEMELEVRKMVILVIIGAGPHFVGKISDLLRMVIYSVLPE